MIYCILDMTRALNPCNFNIMVTYTRPAITISVNMGGTKFHKAAGNQQMLRVNHFSSRKSPLFSMVNSRHLYMWATLIKPVGCVHTCTYARNVYNNYNQSRRGHESRGSGGVEGGGQRKRRGRNDLITVYSSIKFSNHF